MYQQHALACAMLHKATLHRISKIFLNVAISWFEQIAYAGLDALRATSVRISSIVVIYFLELNSLSTRSHDLLEIDEAIPGLLAR